MRDEHPHLKPHLSGLMGNLAPKAVPEDQADRELPDPNGPYQAHARAANKPVYTLHCCLGQDGYRSYQYVHLDSDSSFRIDPRGHVITLRFAGTTTTQLTISGRNLWQLYDYLHQHRIAWIMRTDRDFGDDKQPVITGLSIEQVQEE